jgi:CheY-specific phosphatase CheX
MGSLADMPPDAQPIAADLHEQLLGQFVVAVETALRELAGTDAAERLAYHLRSRRCRGAVVALIDLSSAAAGSLALGFAEETAAALARRVLSETLPNPDDALIRDCLGEITNVTAGQAKALLHGTPYAFTFGTPRITSAAELPTGGKEECLVAVMATDVGEFVLQLFIGPAVRS